MSKIETLAILEKIVSRVTYDNNDKWFMFGEMGDGFYIQIQYLDTDIISGEVSEQHGRKWYVSGWCTESEVIQTMLAAALASAEHEVREKFLVDGERIYGPHLNANMLVQTFKEHKANKLGTPLIDARQHEVL